jgi:hypothetical protein
MQAVSSSLLPFNEALAACYGQRRFKSLIHFPSLVFF